MTIQSTLRPSQKNAGRDKALLLKLALVAIQLKSALSSSAVVSFDTNSFSSFNLNLDVSSCISLFGAGCAGAVVVVCASARVEAR